VPVSLRRTAAIQAGAVPALFGILQAGAAHSVPIALDDVLKASAAVYVDPVHAHFRHLLKLWMHGI
jgi:hypothetical protein